MTSDVRKLSERVEVLLERLEPRVDAEELVRTLVTLYGEALSRTVHTVRESTDGERILEAVCADDFVASVMIVHDLHPVPLETRIERALDGVRPYLHSHGGEVEVAGIDDGVVELHLSGTCDGCPSSSATLKLAVERAIFAAAPEIIEVRANVANVAAEREHEWDLPSISMWATLEEPGDLKPCSLRSANLDSVALLLIRGPQELYAYHDRCPACSRTIQAPVLNWPHLRCAGCGETYDVERAGRCAHAGLHLEPLPLRNEDGRIRIAVPASA